MDEFFHNSDLLDIFVTRPLSHFTMNWELTWDEVKKQYQVEESSFAEILNTLLNELETVDAPNDYHTHEDALGENVIKFLKWDIKKVGTKWIGEEYQNILTQGGFTDADQNNLLMAAAGRIMAAKERQQNHFDDMENGHRKQLSSILTIILYHRSHNLYS